MATASDSMDSAARPAIERCRATLAENLCRELKGEDWVGMDEGHSVVNGDMEVWGAWELPERGRLSHYLDFLVKYTSAENKQASTYVQDPRVGTEQIFGKYRLVAAKGVRKEGKLYVVRGLRRVFAVATAAELAALRHRKTRDNEILKAFNLQPGEGDALAFVFEDLDPASANETAFYGLADADLVTALPGAGWMYVDRKFEHVGESNVARGMVLFEKAVWGNSTPTYTQNGRGNVGGWGETKGELAPGVPQAGASAAVVAKAAASGFVLGEVGFEEREKGEVLIRSEQRIVFTYLSEADPLVAVPTKIRILGEWGNQKAGVEFWWPRTAAARIVEVVAAAEVIGNYVKWFPGKYLVADKWAVREVEIRRDPDTAATIVATIGIEPDEGTTIGNEDWNFATDIWYTHEYVRDEDGAAVWAIKYANQQAHRTSRPDAEDFLATVNAVIAPKCVLASKSGIQRLGARKYVVTAVWVDSESVPP